MKVFVAGAGLMGRAVVEDLVSDPQITEIKVVDISEANLAKCTAMSSKVKTSGR